MSAPTPGHRALDAFVGTWRTEGVVRATPDAPAFPFTAVDRYAWMEGGFFLLHDVDARMGGESLKALEVISHDPATDTYPMRSYDSRGNTGAHEGRLRGGTWTFTGATERFTGAFSADGATFSGLWERSADGEAWEPWMDVTLTRG